MAKKILLIDDEELVIKSVSRLLNKEGYEVLVSRSGEDAIEKAKSEAIDLVVCDIRMPKLSGIETIKKIRELRRTAKQNPVREILITGYAEEATNREAESLRVAEYIYKPFDLRDFLACVKKNIEA